MMAQGQNIQKETRQEESFRTLLAGREVAFRLEVPARRTRQEAWQQLHTHLRAGKVIPLKKKRSPLRAVRRAMPAAATLALLIALAFSLLRFGRQTCTAVAGETLSLLLPDSSEVILNGGSSLHFNKLTWHLHRKVSLGGEAFFRVTKGRRFSVVAGGREVTVLGTRFTVLSRDNRFGVWCYSGKVKVSSRHQKEGSVILTRGKYVEMNGKSSLQPRLFNPDEHPSWQKQDHHFSNTPLAKVLEVFARHYHVTLDYDTAVINNRYYTGFFPENEMQEALEMICLSMGLDYSTNGKNIKITNKN